MEVFFQLAICIRVCLCLCLFLCCDQGGEKLFTPQRPPTPPPRFSCWVPEIFNRDCTIFGFVLSLLRSLCNGVSAQRVWYCCVQNKHQAAQLTSRQSSWEQYNLAAILYDTIRILYSTARTPAPSGLWWIQLPFWHLVHQGSRARLHLLRFLSDIDQLISPTVFTPTPTPFFLNLSPSSSYCSLPSPPRCQILWLMPWCGGWEESGDEREERKVIL